jgi:tRNA-2-methylthio-N6-dimethylallyladenosine synthase
LGQNVNAYNFKNKKLSDLLYSLNEIKDLKRIRYTTSHPRDFTDDLVEAHNKCEKLMPLLHLPIQSGSVKILKSMNRGHSIEEYLEIIEKLEAKKPSIKFSSDFIIAYPGETKVDFNKTISILKKVKFVNSYSFIFSSRPGTPAADLKKIDYKIAIERLHIFQKVANDMKKEYRRELINSRIKVLFENKIKNENEYFGRDEHFNSVIVKSKKDLTGKIKDIIVNDCNQNTLFGEIISKKNDDVEFAA